jgi:hypothetical protein
MGEHKQGTTKNPMILSGVGNPEVSNGVNHFRFARQPPAVSQFSKTGLLGVSGFYLVDKRDERYAPIEENGPPCGKVRYSGKTRRVCGSDFDR